MSAPLHVLFDADGVLQRTPGGWVRSLEPFLGDRAEAFLLETVEEERPCLVGQGDFREVLAGALARWDVGVDVDEVYAAVWTSIEVDAGSLAVVAEVRDSGAGVHLASTQEAGRAAHMRGLYDGLVDTCFFSCELGLPKSDPAYFTRVADALEARPEDLLFVDDHPGNVDAARTAGLRAEHWHLDHGHDRLRSHLAGHGALPKRG